MTPVLLVYSVAVAGLALFGLHRLALLLLYAVSRVPAVVDRRRAAAPRVTVQLPIFNERWVATRLLLATARLEYPRDRLEIQVLDDSTDDTSDRLAKLIRRLRRLGLDVVHLRRVDREGFKAGALAQGLQRASGEFIAVFDADFVPPPGFLERLIGEFEDPAVGMVQARWDHLNRESSLLTRLQAIFLDGHFLVEHAARHRSGRFFNFNGTAGIWRRAAIVSAGGWQHDTLTEDLDLSYRAQIAGWRFVYRPDVRSPAELPSDMNAFKAQQHRWAKGSVQTARKLLPRVLRSSLPWHVRLEAALHLTNNLSYLFAVVPVLLWVPTLALRFDRDNLWMIALASAMALTTLCVVAYHVTCQALAGRSRRGALAEMPALLSLGIGLSLNNGRGVVEALAGHRSPFLRTPKIGDRLDERSRLRYALRAHWLTALELAVALYFCVGLALAIHSERWLAIPFVLLFLFGFGYVGLSSLGRAPHTAFRVGAMGACLSLFGMLIWASQEYLWRWIG